MLLLPFYTIVVQPLLAELLGLREAMLMQQLYYMSEHYNNGRGWQGTYADLAALVPKTAEPTAKRIANNMVELGLLTKEDTRPITWHVNESAFADMTSILVSGPESDLFDLLHRVEVDQNDLPRVIKMIRRARTFYTREEEDPKIQDLDHSQEAEKREKENSPAVSFTCSSCGKSNIPAADKDKSGRCVYCYILSAWAFYSKRADVQKIQPQVSNAKLAAKAVARVKSLSLESVRTAIETAFNNRTLVRNGWFQLDYLLRSDDNITKTLDPHYWAWMEQERAESNDGPGRSIYTT